MTAFILSIAVRVVALVLLALILDAPRGLAFWRWVGAGVVISLFAWLQGGRF